MKWYVGAVEFAVKSPLRAHLAADPNVREITLGLSYGLILGGLNTVRHRLYEAAGIRFDSNSASLREIVSGIRGE